MTAEPAAKDESAWFDWVFERHEILDITRRKLVQCGEMSKERVGLRNETAVGVTPGTRKLGRRQNSSIWSFLAILWAIAPSFWLRGRFQWLVTPGT